MVDDEKSIKKIMIDGVFVDREDIVNQMIGGQTKIFSRKKGFRYCVHGTPARNQCNKCRIFVPDDEKIEGGLYGNG